jgi:hypothetical protein
MTARLAALGSLLVVLVAAAPTPARDGSIKLKRSIAGVKLNATEADVRLRLGAPSTKVPSELHGGWTRWIYRSRRLSVTFASDDHVWDVRTTSSRDRTATGVGVGSTERTVRRRVRGVRCRGYGGPSRYRHWRVCVDDARYRGPFTEFVLVRGRVFRVKVARGLAV